MSENIYEFTWRDWSNWKLFVRRTAATNPLSIGIALDGMERVMHLPSDPAELHKLTEAIHGRKVAAIVYEDELPELDANGERLRAHGRVTDSLAESERGEALLYLARARFHEARDAAAKEQERAEEERYEAWRQWVLANAETDPEDMDYVSALDVIETLVKAGVPVPQGEEAGR